MDQDSFRKLLSTPAQKVQSKPTPSKPVIAASEPAFKPRKISKKNGSAYRDRAAERRLGVASDFAEAEALLEQFEKQNVDNKDKEAVEAQRRYLGGDSEHSVLVKGLDFALFEQYKLKESATAAADDESLESAFREATKPQKRTREEIVRELKAKRSKRESTPGDLLDSTSKLLDETKTAGKFKPIGFKAADALVDSRKSGAKKKKKKVNTASKTDTSSVSKSVVVPNVSQDKEQESLTSVVTLPEKVFSFPPETDKENNDDDIDIFAGAGEYEGLNLDDDDDEEPRELESTIKDETTVPTTEPRSWFVDDDQLPSEVVSDGKVIEEQMVAKDPEKKDQDEGEIQEPARLVPLASSSVPSIRDILIMNEALEAEDKRKARKEKRKGGGGEKKKENIEAKLNRDYQKLKSYTEKKDLN